NNVQLACTYSGGSGEIALYSGSAPDIQVDVRDLAQLAAGKNIKKQKAANEIFIKQKTIFFNTY
ncbi:MAG: hypothetical protein WCP73_06630, partial [Eubacteriales bacterium]